MTYQISQTDPRTMSTEDIKAEFQAFTKLAVEVVKRWSDLMAELKRRRHPLPFRGHAIMSFYQAIADEQLSPEAALILRQKDKIKAVLPLQQAQQVKIANGAPVNIAYLGSQGETRQEVSDIHTMSPASLKRAFGPNGIRSIHQQAEMIRAEGKVHRVGMITVLRDEGVFKIGNQKLTPDEIDRAARQMGYRLVLTRSLPDSADKTA